MDKNCVRNAIMTLDPDRTFVTSDHHFGSWKHNPSPFRPPVFTQEEEESLVSKWNSVVNPTDLVIYVGDFCDGDEESLESYKARLNGDMILVKGNHDDLPASVYEKHFRSFCLELFVDDLNLFFRHDPFVAAAKGFRMIYGHMHDGDGMLELNPRTAFCTCVMRNGGFPIRLRDVLDRMAAADEKQRQMISAAVKM